jgi:hypothetical protein
MLGEFSSVEIQRWNLLRPGSNSLPGRTLTGFFATFHARRTFGNSAGLINTDHILQPFSHPKTSSKPDDRLEAIL